MSTVDPRRAFALTGKLSLPQDCLQPLLDQLAASAESRDDIRTQKLASSTGSCSPHLAGTWVTSWSQQEC
jgi:hypothetical protein